MTAPAPDPLRTSPKRGITLGGRTRAGGNVMRLVGLAIVLCLGGNAPVSAQTSAKASAQPPANASSSGTAPQKAYAECVPGPRKLSRHVVSGFRPGGPPGRWGPRVESGWREVANRAGCEAAAATLIAHWRERHAAGLDPPVQSFMAFHEGQDTAPPRRLRSRDTADRGRTRRFLRRRRPGLRGRAAGLPPVDRARRCSPRASDSWQCRNRPTGPSSSAGTGSRPARR